MSGTSERQVLHLWNPHREPPGPATALDLDGPDPVLEFHRGLSGYRPTPLHSLPQLARELGVGGVFVKDESERFGLKAFKVLGASYGICRMLEQRLGLEPHSLSLPDAAAELARRGLRLVLTAATDGNHGRAVAWTARQLGQEAVIFVPRDMQAARRDAIEAEGARVRTVEGVYDRAVREAEQHGRRPGWVTVSDTADRQGDPVPEWITRGYRTLFSESARQLAAVGAFPPAVVMLQAGVGAFARAAVDFYGPGSRPRLVIVEPLRAAGLLESASSEEGRRRPARGDIRSLMAGLNCAWPSQAAWPKVRRRADLFAAIGDGWAKQAVRRLYRPQGEDPGVIAGESGAAGLAGLLALATLPEVRRRLPLDRSTSVLLVNTEGDTDPENFRRLVGQ